MRKPLYNQFFKISLLIFLFSYACTFAQSEKTTYKILNITVSGSTTADPNTIIANSGLKVGDELEIPSDAVINAIKRLMNLNIFSDVQVLIEKKIQSGVFLVIKVEEYPRLEKIVVVGNDDLSDDKVLKNISVSTGQIIKFFEISRDIQKIKKLYYDDGYLNVKISPEYFTFMRADTAKGEITITWRNTKDFSREFTTKLDVKDAVGSERVERIKTRTLLMLDINEGNEVIVRKIEFEGNKAFTGDELKGTFDETKESKWWKFWASAKFKRADFEKDEILLDNFYKKNGYMDFRVLGDSLIYSNNKKDLTLLVKVYEGKQYKIRNISYDGNTVFTTDFLNARLGFKKGDIYDQEKFERAINASEKQDDIRTLYMDKGFLGIRIDTKEQIVQPDSVDLNVQIVENSRFKIDRIEITGNDKTKDKVIRRELYTIPGDYFNKSNVMRSIQQLSQLQYFQPESLQKEGVTPQIASDSTVNLIYKVTEKSSDYLNASIGYNGTWGFSGSLGFTFSNFSLAEPFRVGGGQILNFDWTFGVGNYYRTFTLGFTEPWFMDTPTSLGFEVFDTRQRYYMDLQQTGLTGRIGRRLTWPDDYFYIQGMARYQHNDIIDGAGYYVPGVSDQYTLGFTITRNDIDNPIFPTIGSKIIFDAQLSGGFLPGNVDYNKYEFRAEWYRPVFNSNRFVLYTLADFGYIDELEKNTPIPYFDLFNMGGNGLMYNTIPLRGYDDRSIGPKQGGRAFMKYTMEFRTSLALEPIPIYLLAFAEAGNATLTLHELDFTNLRKSAGIGARIMLQPVGLIGFDYAYGFDRLKVDGNKPGWMFHIQFGKGF